MNVKFRVRCPGLGLFNILHALFILLAVSVTLLLTRAPGARSLETLFSTIYSSSLKISSTGANLESWGTASCEECFEIFRWNLLYKHWVLKAPLGFVVHEFLFHEYILLKNMFASHTPRYSNL